MLNVNSILDKSAAKQPLTVAITKGRIMDTLVPLLAACNIKLPTKEALQQKRLILDSECKAYRFLILRGNDAATYVRLGAADIGIVGRDILLEWGYDNLYELLDLEIAQCRIITAEPIKPLKHNGHLLVATKYENIARRYYQQLKQPAQIIKLYGSIELAPLIGISHQIVDIVETGETLKNNGLKEIDTIATSSVRLIANQAVMRFKHHDIQQFKNMLAIAKKNNEHATL